ncbi:hypothetical protein DL763_005812 [Monosporascus cannonballus]|nr:hypothetical protein DL763_005812 [Monosporascus cannonballus]
MAVKIDNRHAPRHNNTSYGTAPGPIDLGTVQRKDWNQIQYFNYGKIGHKAYKCKTPKKPRQDKWKPVPEGQPKENQKNDGQAINMI